MLCPAKFNYWASYLTIELFLAKNSFQPLVDSAHVRSIIIALFSTGSEIYIEFYKMLNEILANYFYVWCLLLVNHINRSTILFEESIYVTIMVNLSKWLIGRSCVYGILYDSIFIYKKEMASHTISWYIILHWRYSVWHVSIFPYLSENDHNIISIQ